MITMQYSLRLGLGVVFFLLPATVSVAAAQQKPTADEAKVLLQTRPDLVALLRQKLATSGMSADQVRARLSAAGYPSDLLDSYLPGGLGTDSGIAPTPNVYSAVAKLGIADSSDLNQLRPGAFSNPLGTYPSLYGRPDSLTALWLDSVRLHPRGLPRGITGAAASPDSGYFLFGFDVFSRPTTQFDANLAGPVDENYRLGPGDQLVLVLTGDVEAAYSLDVTREGFVVIPQVGQVSVANLTLGQLRDVLYSRLGRVYSGIRRNGGSTQFSVSPARLRTNQIYVLGDVQRPSSYRVSGAGTVLTALYAAGGPTEAGSLRRVLVRRAGHVVDSLDVYDYLLRGDAAGDVRLENGDIVFVGTHGARVRVIGQVLRPMTYEVKRGETIDELISAAGGFTAQAGRRRIQIERIVPPEMRSAPGRDRQVIDVTADQMVNGAETGIPVENGDVVRVFAVADRVRNRVTVEGDVWAPGFVGFSPGMTVERALKLAGGVKPDVYVGEVLISRLQSDSTRVQLRTSLRDTLGTVNNDLPVLEDDIVRVFSASEFRPERYVAVVGAVRNSGRYPYREGMTLRDLVLLAGGLQEKAYLKEAEVARLPENRAGGRLATTVRVPLDSSYLFERSPNGKYLGPPGIAASSGSAPEVPLKPYDNVLIMEQPDWNLQRTVTLAGEVRFPGTYALTTKGEKLGDLIQRAGGLTDQAYADGVSFYRKSGNLGRIGIDLSRVLKDANFRDNLILQDGDSIFLPQFSAVVDVKGAVGSPVAVAYVPGKDLNYYISAAGGLTRKAEGNRAYVIQPNGTVESISRRPFFPDGQPTPRPGSVVMVPERDASEKGTDFASIAGTVAQIAGSLVAIVALVINSRK